jgi:hypothetical protein
MFDGTYLRNNRKQNEQQNNPGGMPTTSPTAVLTTPVLGAHDITQHVSSYHVF